MTLFTPAPLPAAVLAPSETVALNRRMVAATVRSLRRTAKGLRQEGMTYSAGKLERHAAELEAAL